MSNKFFNIEVFRSLFVLGVIVLVATLISWTGVLESVDCLDNERRITELEKLYLGVLDVDRSLEATCSCWHEGDDSEFDYESYYEGKPQWIIDAAEECVEDGLFPTIWSIRGDEWDIVCT